MNAIWYGLGGVAWLTLAGVSTYCLVDVFRILSATAEVDPPD